MSAGFEIWDSKSHNVLQFDELEDALEALRGLVERNGAEAVDGLSLDVVSEDEATRLTLAEDDRLLGLVSKRAAA